MAEVNSLCVYCGSAGIEQAVHKKDAEKLGKILAENGIGLVYGGGYIGLMGILADAVLAGGGRVTGVLPRFFEEWEVEHQSLNEMLIVNSMHERKQKMFDLADAFAILPGGLGTLDEALEVLAWKQLKLHEKPIILIDAAGYWTPFLELFEHIIAEGYAQTSVREMMHVVAHVEDVLPALARAPTPTKKSDSRRL